MEVVKTRQIPVELMLHAVLRQLLRDKTRTLRRRDPRKHRVEELAAFVSYNIFDKEQLLWAHMEQHPRISCTTLWLSTMN